MAYSILVPVDGSAFAAAAARVALQLGACKPGAVVTALHVVNVRAAGGNLLADLPGQLGFEPAIVDAAASAAALARGQAALDQVIALGAASSVTVIPSLVVGPVASTILAHGQAADLVVLGLRGETEERFPGQGGEMIAWLPSRLPTPVLMVPRGVDHVSRVALGYDGSDAARHVAEALGAALEGTDVPVDALHVSTDGSGASLLEEVDACLPGREVSHQVVSGSDPYEALCREARARGASVLALGVHGTSPLRDFLFGTTAERVEIDGTLGVFLAH